MDIEEFKEMKEPVVVLVGFLSEGLTPVVIVDAISDAFVDEMEVAQETTSGELVTSMLIHDPIEHAKDAGCASDEYLVHPGFAENGDSFLVVVGNLFDGFKFIGPFKDDSDATMFAEDWCQEYRVMKVEGEGS